MGFTSSHVEAASTLAVIAFSNEPLSFLAGDLRIIAASASFCRTFQIDPASVPGRQLSELGAGEWAMPKLASLLKATASGSAEIAAYEIDLVRNGVEPRYLVVNARKLDDGDDDRVRLLLAVSSIGLQTASRSKVTKSFKKWSPRSCAACLSSAPPSCPRKACVISCE
jgi:hypothetical protein